MWRLKYDVNELIYETDSRDTENRLVVVKEEVGMGRMERGSLGLADEN